MTTQTQVPTGLVVGDSWAWERELADYPAPTWSVTWYFSSAADNFSVASTPNGTAHAASLSTTTTALLNPGIYRWQAVVTDGTQRVTLGQEFGEVELLANPATAGAADFRSAARTALENVEAYLADPDNLTAASYSLSGRALSRFSFSELLALRSQLEAEVRREAQADRIKQGLGNPRRLYVRFDRG